MSATAILQQLQTGKRSDHETIGAGSELPIPFGVVGANMGCKLSVALQLEGAHHFLERCARRRTRRLEPPPTFGATKSPKQLLLNPYQFPTHVGPRRCTPSPSEPSCQRVAFVCG